MFQNKPISNKIVGYSALGFQWIVVFVGLSLGGNWIDKTKQLSFPAFTLLGVFLALFIIFYSLFKLVSNQNKSTKHDA
jgi:hypothetical protein